MKIFLKILSKLYYYKLLKKKINKINEILSGIILRISID